MPGEFCRTYRHAVSFSGTFGALVTGCARSYPLRNGLQAGVGGGFALHEALWLRVAGVSEPHVVQFPRLVAVRPRLTAVSCPKCRPPRQKPAKTGCRGRGGLRFGHQCVSRGVLFAREPLNMRVSPLFRASTRYVTRQPAIWSEGGGCPRSH